MERGERKWGKEDMPRLCVPINNIVPHNFDSMVRHAKDSVTYYGASRDFYFRKY